MMSFDDGIPKRNTKAIALPLMSSLPLANLAIPMWQQPARQSGKFPHPFSMSPPLRPITPCICEVSDQRCVIRVNDPQSAIACTLRLLQSTIDKWKRWSSSSCAIPPSTKTSNLPNKQTAEKTLPSTPLYVFSNQPDHNNPWNFFKTNPPPSTTLPPS